MVAHDRSAAICSRIEEDATRYIEGSGHLHILKHTEEWLHEETPHLDEPLPEHNEVLAIWGHKFIKDCEQRHVDDLAGQLKLPPAPFRRMNIGWSDRDKSWTFPMLRKGRRLLGIRRRDRRGEVSFVRGSKNGLFIPNNTHYHGIIFICVGESDTAALLSCNMPVVGRTGCLEGAKLLMELLEDLPVIICVGRGEQQFNGAERLKDAIAKKIPDSVLMHVPEEYSSMLNWVTTAGKQVVREAGSELIHDEWGLVQ